MAAYSNGHAAAGTTASAGATEQSESHFTRAVQLLDSQGTVMDACYTTVGDRVATTTDQGAVQIWDCSVTEARWQLLHTEQLPATPTQLAWAHGQFGACLAVGSAAGSVHIIQGPLPGGSSSGSSSVQGEAANAPGKQQQQRRSDGWCCTAVLPCGHEAVSTLAFGPHQQGLVLAVACRERPLLESVLPTGAAGRCLVLLFEGASPAPGCLKWTLTSKIEVPEAAGTCSCLSWHASVAGLPPLLAGGHSSGGCIWAYRPATMMWQEVASFSGPPDIPARAQALHWAPSMGRPYELLAASYGTAVLLYRVVPGRVDGGTTGVSAGGQAAALPQQLGALDVAGLQELHHPQPVWRLEFNVLGNALACSLDGTPEVWLWMPTLDGSWQVVTKLRGGAADGGATMHLDDGGAVAPPVVD